MKKILVVSSNLTKESSPASSIEINLINNLTKEGIKPVAIGSTIGKIEDERFDFTVIRVKEFNFVNHIFGAIGLVFPDFTRLPDGIYYSWGKKAFKESTKILKEGDFDCILTIGFPNACHWIGYKLKAEYKIPWIATFFDSWTDYPSRKFKTSYFRKLDEKMERVVMENADIVVHSNNNIKKIWENRYGIELCKKIAIIPINFSEEGEIKSPLVICDKEIVKICHIGTFYPYRDASAFIKAVNVFAQKYPALRNRIKIYFVGKVLGRDRKLINNYKIDDLFVIVGRVSSEECQNYYRMADLLLATAGDYGENVMFPSKILKYFYYDRPILGISHDNTILRTELERAGHIVLFPESKESIADYLYQSIIDYKSICNYDHDYWKNFSTDTCAQKYLNIIQRL